ncbi:terminase large subunit domain-containing protein [Kitasatospora cathayae]|uniref:Terminase large subunit n=1 Tax=Kitasatospora cathayae TaxID=3004092 RepID=A0ABY7Q2Y7_9ACTN|nr:terminase large subunit [Kitasatospora sp. HUAS 3-15]WBP87048.1 terminase large subunit [Kitasatospora sp. HUAS 3-15]
MGEPLFVTPVSAEEIERGDGPDFGTFSQFLKITKDSVGGPTGGPMVLRPWQSLMLGRLFARRADGRYKHRQALIGMPRKNGKSALGAGIALYGLAFGPQGGEVYSCAADKEQARIVFGTAKKMIDLQPEFSGMFNVYRDAIEFPATGSVYRVLSAEAFSKEGLSATLVMFDEVHAQPNRELWDVMALSTGARAEPLMVGITTAGVKSDSTGQDSLCYGMYQYAERVASGETIDPSFYCEWWGAPEGADHTDPAVWEAANPGFGDIVAAEDFEAAVLRTPENEFRTKRLNQWTSTAQAWLPAGAWDACEDSEVTIPDGSEVVLGFDGSFSNDSTALVVVSCTVSEDDKPHVDVVAAWEKPQGVGQDWAVPIIDVEDEIRRACRKWQVREIVCDPFRWARTYQILEGEGLPVVEFPQSPARMTPATQRFYEAVLNETVTHSGDPRLARHLANCVIRTDSRGSRLSKDSKGSPRKIDLAVSAVMALERACQEPERTPEPQFWSWADL